MDILEPKPSDWVVVTPKRSDNNSLLSLLHFLSFLGGSYDTTTPREAKLVPGDLRRRRNGSFGCRTMIWSPTRWIGSELMVNWSCFGHVGSVQKRGKKPWKPGMHSIFCGKQSGWSSFYNWYFFGYTTNICSQTHVGKLHREMRMSFLDHFDNDIGSSNQPSCRCPSSFS